MGSGCSSEKSAGIDHHAQPYSTVKAQRIPALKLAIVGDAAVGKTNILLRYLRNQFSPLYIATQRAVIENKVMKVNLPSHAVVSLTIWDIPGREDIDLYSSYFKNLDAAIVVVDVSDPESIMMANVWKQIVMNNIEKTTPVEEGERTAALPVDPEKFPVLLLGTKCDIVEQQLQAQGKSLYPVGKKLKDTNFSKIDDSLDESDTEIEKPECVVQLENIAEQHAFVGSVVVSARDGDGSVHTAVQSFLRHILETQYMERRWKTRSSSPEVKKKHVQVAKKLDVIGVEQVDQTFSEKEVHQIFERVDKLKYAHKTSLKKFQQLCEGVGVVEHGEGDSVQNCILGLRRFMAEADFKLQLVEKNNLCKLKVERLNTDTHMSGALKDILKTFNKEVMVSSAAILYEFPPFEEQLKKVDNRVSAVVERYEEPAPPGTQASDIRQQVRNKSDKIEKNRGVIQFYQESAVKACQEISDMVERVRIAFMW